MKRQQKKVSDYNSDATPAKDRHFSGTLVPRIRIKTREILRRQREAGRK